MAKGNRKSTIDYQMLIKQVTSLFGYKAMIELKRELVLGLPKYPCPQERRRLKKEGKAIPPPTYKDPKPANARESQAYAKIRQDACFKLLELYFGTSKRSPFGWGDREEATILAKKFVQMTSDERQAEKERWIASGEVDREMADRMETDLIKAGDSKLLGLRALKRAMGLDEQGEPNG